MLYCTLSKANMKCCAMYTIVYFIGVFSIQIKAQTFSLRNCNGTGDFSIVQHQQTSLSCIGLSSGHTVYWSITDPSNAREERIGECSACNTTCPQCSVLAEAYNISRPASNTTVLQLPDQWDISDGAAIKCSRNSSNNQTVCQVSVVTEIGDEDSMKAAEIAGGAVGLIALIVVVLVVAVVIKRKGSAKNPTADGRDGGHVNEGAVDIMNDTFLSLEDVRALMVIRNLGHPVSIEHLEFSNAQSSSNNTRPDTTANRIRHKKTPQATTRQSGHSYQVREEGKSASSERADNRSDQTYAQVQKKVKKNTNKPDRGRPRRDGRGKKGNENANQDTQEHSSSPVYKNIGEVSRFEEQEQDEQGAKSPRRHGASTEMELSEFNTTGTTKTETTPTTNQPTRKAAGTVAKAADIDDDYQSLHFTRLAGPKRDSTYNHITTF